ncbi:MAG: type VI secretion system protein TssA [Colwellia sp.]|nr:type VI secretion system protein TssA [Colwellia sp.]
MDYDQLIITAVDAANECGNNLEDDSSFQNLFFEAEGSPERFDGQTTSPAEPPDWRSIKKQANEYLKKTRDLKLLSIFAQSVLNTEGIIKFEQCLNGIAQLVENQWMLVYPLLDEDDGDPLERISALGHLSDKTFIVKTLKSIPIIQSKVLGNITLQLIDRANDPSTTKKDSDLDIAQVKGIFKDSDNNDILQIYNAVNQSVIHLNTISQTFIAQAGNEYSVNFDVTTDVLTHLANTLKKYGNLKEEIVEAVTEPIDEIQTPTTSSISTVSETTMNTPAFDSTDMKLTSRQDVEHCFDLICNYYNEFEPSSPIPVLVNRSKKLVNLDFLAIVKDIFPDALEQVQKLGGITEPEQDSESSSTTSDSSSDSSW